MFKSEIRKPKSKHGAIKIYARVQRTPESDEHLVIKLRLPGMKRWICDCEDFMFRKLAKRKHCDHIKFVKAAVVSGAVYAGYLYTSNMSLEEIKEVYGKQ